ncbi:HAMP domain-containing protein [Parapedobacter composti]|uniref:histidine kinase n=1 Tax=Parapedobacter composti TaxID=623281 RepID=A0A1I1EVL9_9SPHI|nr:HAMP domain-containing sensor histidine kinase [Parapedobacter composti]SFB91017.1 HAMP domain-containing protein [Parapedobacter composti]
MSTVVKIRLLLLVLTLCFIGTAITISLTFNDEEILLLDGRNIQRNLHAQEQVVNNFIQDTSHFNAFRSIAGNPGLAEDVIDYFVKKHDIYPFVYANNELIFWGTDRFVPETDAGISDGVDIIKTGNGWYESIKKSAGNFSVLFLIPIKTEFEKNNTHLQNRFSKRLTTTNNLEIANYDDPLVYPIRSITGEYLFSIKLRNGEPDFFFSKLGLAMWVLAGISTVLLLHIMCVWLAKRGRVWLSILLFTCSLMAIRILDLHYGLLSSHFYYGIFDPRNFASSFLFPHLGGFLFNICAFTWSIGYIHIFKDRLTLPSWGYTKAGRVALIALFALLIYLVSYGIADIFKGLITNSDINFDVTNILNLNAYSWMGIFALCLSIMALLLLIDLLVALAHKLIPDIRQLLFVQIIVAGIAAAVHAYFGGFNLPDFSFSFILIVILIGLRTWYSKREGRIELPIFISTLLLLAAITAIKHSQYQRHKKEEEQKLAISRLEAIDDANAIALFYDLEKEIPNDPLLIEYFSRGGKKSRELLHEHLKRTYLSGHLSKYEFTADAYDTNWMPLGGSPAGKRLAYRDKVIAGAIKVSENFYRGSSRFGSFEYFAQLPVTDDEGDPLGILLIELKNRSFSQLSLYPDILADSRIGQQQTELITQHAYAFYQDNKLVSQYGDYVYPLSAESYPSQQRKHISLGNEGGFEHMIYRPNSRTLIVVSRPQQSNWMQLAALSFLFLVFLLFAILAFVCRWLVLTLNSNGFSFRNLRWSFLILTNKVLYSTRIQTFMVAAVVFTLIITGIITFFSISSQFKKQQENGVLKDAIDIAGRLESRILKEASTSGGIAMDGPLNTLAESIASDLNLYRTNGQLTFSTQPRIYDLKLVSRYMHPEAWLHMAHYQRSEFIQHEQIGDLNYIVAYAPIRNDTYEPVAFLSLPYYGYQKEFDQNVGLLLNTLVNIYALVILVLGLFAVFVANKITAPLALVQRSLAKTTIGQQNEPIFWKRHDEIGSLIREYNLMIAALEQSANTIMRSERESAWREMAKQVAHEIKNPLTPLKLGIQQLERSWREKDPRFDERFERFSASFIEQIESLSRIASEFSEFAKMPDTQLKEVDILDIINKAAEVFSNNVDVNIRISNQCGTNTIKTQGDPDQLLRSFNNLIKNSIEATTLSKRRCYIDISLTYDPDKHIVIAIRDNGHGITPEAREKLFQPNFTTKSSGTGLGLAFVKQAVEGMGGSISYETQVGKGTVFYVRIPSAQVRSARQPVVG